MIAPIIPYIIAFILICSSFGLTFAGFQYADTNGVAAAALFFLAGVSIIGAVVIAKGTARSHSRRNPFT